MMDGRGDGGRFSLLGRRPARGFEVRQVAIPPGSELLNIDDRWRDALVVVERGEIELVCRGGTRRWFSSGDVLCLADLALRSLRNRGPDPALLSAVSLRRSVP